MEKQVRLNMLINFMLFLLISSLILFNISCATEEEPTKEAADETVTEATSDFITLYPGVYTEKEKALVEKYFADNRAFE